jgi:BirA family biotin operon repressor/biotin-[acetyl-CoA-carboxylase] ligase
MQLPDGYSVVADHQTDGRGRFGRSWVAPPGTAVLCSILLRPDLGPEELHLAAWVVALAAVQACRGVSGVELALKWPNDLTAGSGGEAPEWLGGRPGAGRKVAGILSEIVAPRTTEQGGRLADRRPPGIVVGIGINVNWPAGWPPETTTDPDLESIAAGATSLNRLAGHEIDRDELVAGMLQATGILSAMLSSPEGRRSIASQYRLCCATIGREVRVQLGDEIVTGRALDVDDAGCLLVSSAACIRTISAGDVVHLR